MQATAGARGSCCAHGRARPGPGCKRGCHAKIRTGALKMQINFRKFEYTQPIQSPTLQGGFTSWPDPALLLNLVILDTHSNP